ncbi:hypothetical protein MATL_G00225420 [Megalops atlanticus]|uniref:Uncharacterized protein n=1 Tax=Megalops atlanticus TaxID=7932 RepID=A0A9D3PHX1_MEGAT|nr:hypothetical protein MATL_G00225420 [Megalops atlanticus]
MPSRKKKHPREPPGLAGAADRARRLVAPRRTCKWMASSPAPAKQKVKWREDLQQFRRSRWISKKALLGCLLVRRVRGWASPAAKGTGAPLGFALTRALTCGVSLTGPCVSSSASALL